MKVIKLTVEELAKGNRDQLALEYGMSEKHKRHFDYLKHFIHLQEMLKQQKGEDLLSKTTLFTESIRDLLNYTYKMTESEENKITSDVAVVLQEIEQLKYLDDLCRRGICCENLLSTLISIIDVLLVFFGKRGEYVYLFDSYLCTDMTKDQVINRVTKVAKERMER